MESRRPGDQRLTRQWRGTLALVKFLLRRVRWRIRVWGLDNFPVGGAVIAFNHHSYSDFLMVGAPISIELGRPTRFLAKREMWESRRTRWLVRFAEAVPVERDSSGGRHGAFTTAVDALEAGDLVAIAPEQTISPSFELLPFRTGAVRMAQAAGVPIIPCIGWGTQRFATKGRMPRMVIGIPVSVRYGAPFEIGPDEDPVVATRRLQELMEGMLDEVQRSYPDEPGPDDDWWVPARLGGSAPAHEGILAAHLERERGWQDTDGRGVEPAHHRADGSE